MSAALTPVETTFSTPDPGFAETLREIASIPISDPLRHEAEAFLFTTLARASWRRADQLRHAERERTARARRRREKSESSSTPGPQDGQP